MTRSSFCNYSDTYILAEGTITVPNTAGQGTAVNNTNKKVAFKNCAPFTNCITELNNAQVDYAEEINIIKRMYNLIKYSNAYSKTSGSLWQCYRDEPSINDSGDIINFPADKIIVIHLNLNNK